MPQWYQCEDWRECRVLPDELALLITPARIGWILGGEDRHFRKNTVTADGEGPPGGMNPSDSVPLTYPEQADSGKFLSRWLISFTYWGPLQHITTTDRRPANLSAQQLSDYQT